MNIAGDQDICEWLVAQSLLEVCLEDVHKQLNLEKVQNLSERVPKTPDTDSELDVPKPIYVNRPFNRHLLILEDSIPQVEIEDLMEIITSFVTLDTFYLELGKGRVCDSQKQFTLFLFGKFHSNFGNSIWWIC